MAAAVVVQVVSARVLEVDAGRGKLYVTLKKSMVKDPLPPLTSYADAKAGQACVGFVTKVADFGIIVTFYANVHGLVPVSRLKAQGVEDPSTAFRAGQLVKCRVARCNALSTPPRLSLDLDVGDAADAIEPAAAAKLVPGQRVSGVVERCADPFVTVKLDGSGATALLHKHHLGDHATLAPALFARMAKGDRVEGAVVLEMKQGSNLPLLTLKPLLLRHGLVEHHDDKQEQEEEGAAAAKDFEVPSLRDLPVGTVVVGCVSRVEDFGLFVRFLGGQAALVPKAHVADHFVTNAAEGLFGEGDTVRCRIQRIDQDKGKVFLSTRRADLPASQDAAFLDSLLSEGARAAAGQGGDMPDWRRYPLGSSTNAKATAIKDYGVVLIADDHRTVMLAPSPDHSAACSVGDEVKVREETDHQQQQQPPPIQLSCQSLSFFDPASVAYLSASLPVSGVRCGCWTWTGPSGCWW